MRAVLRATLAARRRARPTAAENSLLVYGLAFRFMATFPTTLVHRLSYQAHSSCLLKDDSASQNYSDCARSAGAHHAAEHYARLV